jgi:cell division protein FtsI (penicillin-binding protein 3)
LGNGRIRWIRVRIGILVLALAAGTVAVVQGAWDLGVARSEELSEMAHEQYTRRITLSARRGAITDRHGEELAVEVEVESVYADPRQVDDPNVAAAVLAPLLKRDESAIVSKLSARNKHFVWLKRRVAPTLAERVRQLDLAGIGLVKESKRFYPNRSLASHVIGFAGIDSKGLEGIERRFDDRLRGNKDAARGLIDARGRVVFADNPFAGDGLVGQNIELTIDRTLQYIVEQELAGTVRTFEAKAGHVVVMDPATGEILALANWPTYNPNSINDSSAEKRRNRAALDVFEPGSTFKIFTLSAALNAGAIRPDDMVFCERGRLEMYDAVIHDDHRDGWLNPTQCLKRSSNICFAKIALKLGKRRLYHYLRRFGFGERTHVQLPFEMRGTLSHFKKWYDIDAATTAFGQGIGVTGIQMVAALSTIANGGTLMRPLIVKRVINPEGETLRTFAPEARRRVISRYTARLVGDMMTSVTEEGGTGKEGSLDGFLVAGKTGTAQKSAGSKGYEKGKWIASFIGFVPADKPRLAIQVVIDEPVINHYGGTVAAPALRRIADQALRYLGVSPRATVEFRKKNKAQRAKKEAALSSTDDQSVASPADAAGLDREAAELGPDQVRAPDLIGMTMASALSAVAGAGLRPVFMGSGVAVEQVPPAGDPVSTGAYVQVNFQPLPEAAIGAEGDADGS